MSARSPRARHGAFVRGYFRFLEGRGVASAVLHGWEDAFEDELSDVDYVIERPALGRVPALVESYCREAGWRLCQVLRHEPTAVFCVCSALDDPGTVVALDACSDYQRNGIVMMTAEQLLEGRQALDGGGSRLSDAGELKYRLIKAAAKRKDPRQIGEELAGYPEPAWSEAGAWLRERWGVVLRDRSAGSVAEATMRLASRTRRRTGHLAIASLGRVAGRLFNPSGLYVAMAPGVDPSVADSLLGTFRGLYFRRGRRAARLGPGELVGLVRSTVFVSPRLGWLGRLACPRSCLFRLEADDPGDCLDQIAAFLHRRCLRREGLPESGSR